MKVVDRETMTTIWLLTGSSGEYDSILASLEAGDAEKGGQMAETKLRLEPALGDLTKSIRAYDLKEIDQEIAPAVQNRLARLANRLRFELDIAGGEIYVVSGLEKK